MIYATAAELATYMDPDAEMPAAVPLATVLIRHASTLVVGATAGATYRTDVDGFATDERTAAALKEATLEQASAWAINDIDPRKGAAGLNPIVTTKSLGDAAVSYGQSAAIQEAIVALASGTSLTDRAYDILRNAGLISNRVGTTVPYIRPKDRIVSDSGDIDGGDADDLPDWVA